MNFDLFCPKPITLKPFTFRDACWDLRDLKRDDDRELSPIAMKIAANQNKWSVDKKQYKKDKGNLASSIGFRVASWSNPIGTIIKKEISLVGIVHPDKQRYLSLKELQRCSSFPDQFKFLDRKSGVERIGNCVPPLFMRAISKNLKHYIFGGEPLTPFKEKNYLDILNFAWQEHLSLKENQPTLISTFAGCGGSSLGHSMAGFREVLVVEWDKNACETFHLNFPDIPIYQGDICQLSSDDVLRKTNLSKGELDLLDGSPPCQGFSTSGKREFNDNRNDLFLQFARLLKELQPKTFIMENVSGMVKGNMKFKFVEILKTLKECGYEVKAWLLNAAFFGVPQKRERLIFIGVRSDIWHRLKSG